MSTLRATLAAAGIKRRPRQVHEYEETAFQKRCVGVLEDLQKIRRDFTFNAVNPVPAKGKAARGLAKGMGARAGWVDLEIIFRGRFIGFELKKRTVTGKPAIGTGYYTRANPEQCLLATRGRPQRLSKGVRKWIDAPRREHSRKPDEAYERTQRLFAGPYLELFGRETRPSWTVWGNQAAKFDAAA